MRAYTYNYSQDIDGLDIPLIDPRWIPIGMYQYYDEWRGDYYLKYRGGRPKLSHDKNEIYTLDFMLDKKYTWSIANNPIPMDDTKNPVEPTDPVEPEEVSHAKEEDEVEEPETV